jgi:hypothetical protein
VQCSVNSFVTKHTIANGSRVVMIGAKHVCPKETTDPNIFAIDGVDVMVFFGCPTTSVAINATITVPLLLGGTASTFGFINESKNILSRFWTGTLSGLYGRNSVENSIEYVENEGVYSSHAQLPGMSGGATVNGKGYYGVSHAIHFRGNGVPWPSFASVIPANEFFPKINWTRASHISDCPGVSILNVPEF